MHRRWRHLISGSLSLFILLAGCAWGNPAVPEPPDIDTVRESVNTSAEIPEPSGKPAVPSAQPSVSTAPVAVTPEGTVTVAFGGDVLIWGRVASAYAREGSGALADPDLADLFVKSDIAMVNLEMPVAATGTSADKEFTFLGSPSVLPFLSEYMGVDIVSLANNHSLDYGAEALLETLAHLGSYGIKYAGAGENIDSAKEPCVISANGKTVAFFAASRVVPDVSWYAKKNTPGLLTTYDPTILNQEIANARERYDFVIVYVHWGKERSSEPEDYQIKLAHGYIDAGADAVIGSHPHVLQGFEIYKEKPIAYSLGNFIFTTSAPATCALKLELSDDGVFMNVLPCRILSPKTSPVYDEEAKDEALRYLESISFGVKIDNYGDVTPATDELAGKNPQAG